MASLPRAADAGQNHDGHWAQDDAVARSMAGVSASQQASGASPSPGNRDDITIGQRMISATSGSLLTSLLVTPLDVVRVRLQSQSIVQPPKIDFSKLALTTNTLTNVAPANLGVTACCREVFFSASNVEYCLVAHKGSSAPSLPGAASGPAIECAVEEAQRRTISSTMDGLRKIARNEGVTTLWRGLSPTLLMTVPANIIYFTGYDWLRHSARSPIAKTINDDYAPLVAGSTARMLAAAAVNPIELFKTRLQAASGASASGHVMETFRLMQDTLSAQGYHTLWRGIVLTMWRDVPFSGIYWWGYETIRAKLTDLRNSGRGVTLDAGPRSAERRRAQALENRRDTFADSFIAGATSGAAASILTMPFDVGKTRTQVYRDRSAGAVTDVVKRTTVAPEERSMAKLLLHIYQSEGLAGLWRGWIPRTLKVAPACAIMISSYEVSKRVFRGVNERRRGEV